MGKPPRRPREIKRAAGVQDSTVRGRAISPSRRGAKQPELFDEPLPEFVEPCLATLRSEVPAGDKWVHEIKWDGYCLMIRIEDGEVTIRTRRGHDWTGRFPSIRDAAKALPVTRALIDGEAVVEVDGIPNFSALQAALGDRQNVPGHKAAHEAVFYAFDLLHLNGVDLMPAPLTERKAAFAKFVEGLTGAIPGFTSSHARELWQILRNGNSPPAVWFCLWTRKPFLSATSGIILSFHAMFGNATRLHLDGVAAGGTRGARAYPLSEQSGRAVTSGVKL
jgi:ATP-dependent DNA ligase